MTKTYLTEMPKKTDIRKTSRSRIRYDCKPEVQCLFVWVNSFPPINKWIDFEKPPHEPLPIGLSNIDMASDYDRKKLKWQKQMIEIGQNFIETISNKCGILALSYIASKNELSTLIDIEQEYVDASKDFNSLKMLHNSSRSSGTKVLVLKHQKYTEAVKKRYELGAEYSKIWLSRYERVKKVKNFLSSLAFIGRSFYSAKKDFSNFDLLNLDDLMFNIYIDENGILCKKEFIVLEYLIGIDVRRIRECKICHNFFWANRIDRQCCTKKCADVFNQRNSRKNKEISGYLYKQSKQCKKG